MWIGLAEQTAARNRDIYHLRGNYLAPGKYTGREIFPGDTTTATLWVEGINPKETSLITITLYDRRTGTQYTEEIPLEILEGNITVNSDDDPEFVFDQNDDIFEDQQDGFHMWPADYDIINNNRDLAKQIENLFPAKVVFTTPNESRMRKNSDNQELHNVSAPLINIESMYQIALNYEGRIIVNPISQSDGISYLHDLKNIYRLGENFYNAGQTLNLSINADGMEKWLLFYFKNRIIPAGHARLELRFIPDKTQPSKYVVMDTCKLDVKPLNNQFSIWSTRIEPGGTSAPSYVYPLDNNQNEIVSRYRMDTNTGYIGMKDYYSRLILFIHGYNVNSQRAEIWNKNMYQRLYWSGYRGNYVGLDWRGNQAGALQFFHNVGNAMHTSPVLFDYLRLNIYSNNRFRPENITFIAHSLGNLIMWDTLRIFAHRFPGKKAAFNTVSIEAAIWEEAFADHSIISYTTYTPKTTYTTTGLEIFSWAFWFNQPECEATKAVQQRINCYVTDDSALSKMRWWDYNSNKQSPYHPDRTQLPNTPRNIEKLWDKIPALIRGTHNPLSSSNSKSLNDISRPLGQVSETQTYPIGFAGSREFIYINSVENLGWIARQHSSCNDLPYQSIYKWFDKVVLKCKLKK